MNLKKIILLLTLIMLTSTSVEAEDLPFDRIVNDYVEGSREVLELIRMKEDGELFFMVGSRNISGVGLIPYSQEVYNFYLNQDESGIYSPLITVMILPGEDRGLVDDDLGDWQEGVHLLPVYALFGVENGQVICEKPFYSATYMNPSHYHGTIRNIDHTQMIEIFMKHMPRLHEVIQAQGIALP